MSAINLKFSGGVDGDLGADLVSDWFGLSDGFVRCDLECIWTGNPQGVLSVEGRQSGSRTIVAYAWVDFQPDGTAHAGSLDAADLDAEDLGEASVRVPNAGVSEFRLRYTRTGGTGTMRVKANPKDDAGPSMMFGLGADGTLIPLAAAPGGAIPISPGPLGLGYTAAEDTAFVTGDSPKVIDLATALGRNANDGILLNDGAGDILVEISEDGTTYGDQMRLESNEALELDGSNAAKLRLTWVADSAYRYLAK